MARDRTSYTTRDDRPRGPQPPPREHLGPCERCRAEGGITLFGRRRPPQQAVIHPNHDNSPDTPMCAYHIEVTAWENVGKRADPAYPVPTCMRELTPAERKHADLAMRDRSPVDRLAKSKTATPSEPRDRDEIVDELRRAMDEVEAGCVEGDA